jgi:hypothetical protein
MMWLEDLDHVSAYETLPAWLTKFQLKADFRFHPVTGLHLPFRTFLNADSPSPVSQKTSLTGTASVLRDDN